MGTEVSITKGSPCGGQLSASRAVAHATPLTLNDLYVSAGTPVNSLSLEPGRQFNIDGTTFSSSSKNSQSPVSIDESAGQKNSLVTIPEVVTPNSNAALAYVRAPEPTGGVQEWWTRMLSGTFNNRQPASGSPSIGESL